MTWMILSSVLGIIGDIFAKKSSLSEGWRHYAFMAAAASLWGSTAFLWVQTYKTKTMSESALIYSPLFMLMTVLVGVLLFNEPFTWRIAVAYVLGVAIVVLLH